MEERTCQACGKPLERRRYPGGTTEPPSAYARRRFCSTSCSATAQHAATATPWRDGPAVPVRTAHPELRPGGALAAPKGPVDRRDAAAFAAALARETDASLRRDPSRWP